MENLLRVWSDFAGAFQAAEHVLLLSDYDGTLTPIVGKPSDALLAAGMREKLSTLATRKNITVGIISGRGLAELKSMVDIQGIYYAGNHGMEIEGPGLSWVSPEAEEARAMMSSLAGELAAALQETAGVIIEDKGLGLSVHYRLVAPGQEGNVIETFHLMTGPLAEAGKIKITSGKKVLEVRPPIDWYKGKAVEAIRREIVKLLKLKEVMTIYLGDDRTDEDGFKVLRIPEGWGIYIGGDNPDSAASYHLDSPADVEALLTRLLEMG